VAVKNKDAQPIDASVEKQGYDALSFALVPTMMTTVKILHMKMTVTTMMMMAVLMKVMTATMIQVMTTVISKPLNF
jgi:hypothetical protein